MTSNSCILFAPWQREPQTNLSHIFGMWRSGHDLNPTAVRLHDLAHDPQTKSFALSNIRLRERSSHTLLNNLLNLVNADSQSDIENGDYKEGSRQTSFDSYSSLWKAILPSVVQHIVDGLIEEIAIHL